MFNLGSVLSNPASLLTGASNPLGWASLGLQGLGMYSDYKANKQNLALQKDFANNSIQWKVADARKAGIHPLYALGASTNMPTFKISGQGDNLRDMARSVDNMGLTQLQKKSIQADIALKMARASEISRKAQNANSQQDQDIINLQPGGHAVKGNKDIQSNLKGYDVVTPLGHRINVSPTTPVSIIEEEYGELPALLYGTAKWLADRNFLNGKAIGDKFARLAHKWKTDRRAAQRFYEGKKYFYGKYLSQYLAAKSRRK